MEFISSKVNINFMKLRFLSFVISASLIVLSIFSWIDAADSKYGVDFLGGVEVVVEFKEDVGASKIRQTLKDKGFSSSIVQKFEDGSSRYSIRIKSVKDDKLSGKIKEALETIQVEDLVIHKQDFVGPIIGDKIRKDGITALALALLGILIYISIRFELRFAIGAIVALVHDVVITTGLFIFAGHEISSSVLAALLTIVGYSLNDTIIVFDRIRENIGAKIRKLSDSSKNRSKYIDYASIINKSINQTLSRTILTSLTTLFVVSALWVFGGGAVSDLAFALVIGVIVGTYSSIFVASPVLLIGIPEKGKSSK